jgi:tetratricopeptide (TPR) repeat protein
VRVAGVAASDTSAAAIREAERLFPDEAQRQKVLAGAAQFLINIGEYAKAADTLRAANSSTPQSDLDMLRKTRRGSELKFSANGAVSAVQHYILALLDLESGFTYSDFLTPEWTVVLKHVPQRTSLLPLLTPFRHVGTLQLGTRALAHLVIGNVEFVPEGSDETGYRVRFADPSRSGSRRTIAWVVKRADGYRVLGLAGDQSASGGEALALAQKGDVAGARRWLNWIREEIAVPSSADPLAVEPFLKLWPARPGVAERDQILAAAASLVARGYYYRPGVEVLSSLRGASADRTFQSDIDFAWAQGLSRNVDYAGAEPVWRRVHAQYPESETAFAALGLALTRNGHLNDALALTANTKPDDDLYAAAQQIRAHVFQLQRKYPEAVEAYRAACKSAKATSVDWNNEAWLTLFAPGVLTPDFDASITANQMTRGLNTADVHTLGALQAETGQFKEARQELLRYLGFFDASAGINDSAQYLMGRIAEGIGLTDTAEKFYSAMDKPKIDTGDAAYDLAQVRLRVMHQKK